MAGSTAVIRRVSKLLISLCMRGLDVARITIHRWSAKAAPVRNVVLYYHAIRQEQKGQFAAQMSQLLRLATPFSANGEPVPCSPGHHVAVTFDDGFKSTVENALPELCRRNIPSTFFIPTGCVGQQPSWVNDPNHPYWNERVVSEAEIADLARCPGVTLGSHSVSHARMDRLPPDLVFDEMVRSKRDLQRLTGCSIDVFSYPHGAHTALTNRLALKAGYQRVYTIDPALLIPNRGCFAAGRVPVDPTDWPIEFRLKVLGAYRWLSASHRCRVIAGMSFGRNGPGRKDRK